VNCGSEIVENNFKKIFFFWKDILQRKYVQGVRGQIKKFNPNQFELILYYGKNEMKVNTYK